MAQWVIALTLVTSLTVSAKVYTQKKISLEIKNTNVGKTLSLLQKSSHVRIVYSEDLFPKNQKITLSASNRPFTEVLSQVLFGTGLDYKIIDSNQVAIVPYPASQFYKNTISGKVRDENGIAIEGATIIEKGTTNGTTSDSSGNFELSVKDTNAIIIISRIGFLTQEILIGDQTNVNVVLKVAQGSLSDVVIVGYGKQKKINLTGAISSINGDKDINWKPVGQVSVALQGTMPGVTVTQSSGQPGSDQGTIRIRGIGTLNDNDPLVLVDGVQMSINDIDANDIANVTVLKDAAASSIYGVRAANGVILVTTKRGSSNNKPKVNYSNYFGWQSAAHISDFVGAQDFMKLMNLTYENSGGSAIFSDSAIAQYNNPNRNTDLYPDNDWARLILTGDGFQQQHSIGVAGGSDNVKYRFSTNYFGQNGLITNMNFDRVTVRLNTDITITPRLTFSADMAARLSKRTEPQDIGAGSAWYQFQSVNNSPLIVNRYSDGTWGSSIVRMQKEGGIYKYNDNLITGNFRADYKVIKGLILSGIASVNYTTDYNSLHTKALDFYDFFTTPHEYLSTLGTNSITKEYADNWFKNFQGLADYTFNTNKHSFHVLLGTSYLSKKDDALTGYRTSIPNGELEEINSGSENGQSTTGTADEYGLLSYFGRVNYSFANKYLLEANIRHDGSSRFADGQRWGTFPSFSAGWRIGAEKFMEDQKIFQELKLRGSWGQLGNDNTSSNYPYQSTYSFSSSYPFGGTLNTAALLSSYPSASLSWETTKMWDIGLDMTVLNKNLDITLDYYVKNTKDILLQLPIPLTTGLTAPYSNAGSVRNKGWEFSANYHNSIGKDFEYNIGLNMSDVINRVTDMKGADYIASSNDIYQAYYTGLPIGSFYGYKAEGLFSSEQDVSNHATQATGTSAGDIKYKDQNGDGVIDDDDRVYIGSQIPRYTYAINLSATYKRFDISALFQGVGKEDVYVRNMDKAPTSNTGNFKKMHLDSWTEDNTNATFPRLSTGSQNYLSSSYWIRSGAYLRLKSVQLGYKFPDTWFKKAGFTGLRIYTSASNLFTITKLEKDIDPEAPNDNRYYPQVRTITFGLNLNF